MPLWRQGLHNRHHTCFGECLTAGQNVDRGVPVLGPGVNGQVTFSDEHDGAGALWAEPMVQRAEHLAARGIGGSDEAAFERLRIIEQRLVDAPQLEQDVRRERVGHEYRFFIKKTIASRVLASVCPFVIICAIVCFTCVCSFADNELRSSPRNLSVFSALMRSVRFRSS